MTDKKVEHLGSPEFQSKVLALLCRDKEFLKQISDAIKPEYFNAISRQWIASTILDHFREFNELPTNFVFDTEVTDISDKATKVAVEAEIKNIQRHISDKDLKYVQEKTLKFCKVQAVTVALDRMIALVDEGELDESFALHSAAMNVVAPRDLGHDWKRDFMERLTKNSRDCIPTPWECINEVMNGGLAKAELGCVAAPSGAGKSWILVALGVECMRQGKNVAHATMELSKEETARRYDTMFIGIPPHELGNHIEEVKQMTTVEIAGNSIINHFGRVNAETIEAWIYQLEARGTMIDMLIVDYPDLMMSIRKRDRRHEELKTIYEELRLVAFKLKIPCWVASQVQRIAGEEEVIMQHHIAESYGKIEVSDFAFTLGRTSQMKIDGTLRANIVKTRIGPDALTFPGTMNVVQGHIEIFNDSPSGGLGSGLATIKSVLAAEQLKRGRQHLSEQLAKKKVEEASTSE